MHGEPSLQRDGSLAVQILHRVFKPEHSGVWPCMTENEISPLLGKVLALVDDHCVEKESIVNREFIGPMQELLKCIRSLEIGCLASKPDPLIAELE